MFSLKLWLFLSYSKKILFFKPISYRKIIAPNFLNIFVACTTVLILHLVLLIMERNLLFVKLNLIKKIKLLRFCYFVY